MSVGILMMFKYWLWPKYLEQIISSLAMPLAGKVLHHLKQQDHLFLWHVIPDFLEVTEKMLEAEVIVNILEGTCNIPR